MSSMRVFYMNDCDWFMAPDIEQAKRLYKEMTGLPDDEAFDEPYELNDTQLERLRFMDEDGGKRSFAELRQMIESGAGPGLFASTEY